MSHDLSLVCGCLVYVSSHPTTGITHTRVIQVKGQACRIRQHEVGVRLYLWEILPASTQSPSRDHDRPLEGTRPWTRQTDGIEH